MEIESVRKCSEMELGNEGRPGINVLGGKLGGTGDGGREGKEKNIERGFGAFHLKKKKKKIPRDLKNHTEKKKITQNHLEGRCRGGKGLRTSFLGSREGCSGVG